MSRQRDNDSNYKIFRKKIKTIVTVKIQLFAKVPRVGSEGGIMEHWGVLRKLKTWKNRTGTNTTT